MEFEQHRVVAMLAADRDPLVDPADADEAGFVDTVRGGDAQPLRVLRARDPHDDFPSVYAINNYV
ncbi:hypothetical protein ACFV4K_24095 [Nocardia sp. NPDC059764]|uniref:hypothetical protein n=1 Tax=Nocardia sp. NPDC059764 TaxID=3346939 RepID=UPI0036464609